jgi:hypothetical protein
MQEFRLDKKYIILMKGCLVIFVAFLLLGFALPFFPDEEKGNPNGTLIVTFICTVVFGFFSVLTWQTIKKLPFTDVAADDDGIWYIHIGKENGLVSWERISRVKERTYLQCLDLLDFNEERLLRVEYQLNGFEIIRHRINEKTSVTNPLLNQSHFSKGPLYHLFYLACVFGFSALGYYVGSDGNPVLGYGAMCVMVAFIIYEYIVTATGVNVGNGYFEFSYPFTKRNVPFSDVEDILIADEFNKGSRIPEVWIVSKKAKKPFKLKQLGADSNVIYKALRKAAKI